MKKVLKINLGSSTILRKQEHVPYFLLSPAPILLLKLYNLGFQGADAIVPDSNGNGE